jgi:Tfp pilus assembly protein PilN
MNGTIKLAINLASRPLRNRRFYFAALTALTAAFLLLAALSVGSFLRYKAQQRDALNEAGRLERTIQASERSRGLESNDVKALQKKYREQADMLNGIIQRKAFGWVQFFALLENALPASSYISSMAPVQSLDGRFEVRFKVISAGLTDLLKLTENLTALSGRPPHIESETRVGGQVVADITLTYARTH